MNYIRTKDGIYELNPPDYESPMCLDGKTITTCVYTKNHEWVAKSEILKQSDNPKELCDEFVVCHNGKTICQFARNVWGYEQIKYLGTSNDFYGAIWTDKGLIYVAKMNEKGEMELI